MKAHIGVDGKTKLIHRVVATPANVHDAVVVGDLLHGDETRVWDDSAYTGKKDSITEVVPMVQDFTSRKGCKNHLLSEEEKRKNHNKSKARARVEHPFGIMKRCLGFIRVRYRGLAKNAHYLFVSCALVNLVIAGKMLLKKGMTGGGAGKLRLKYTIKGWIGRSQARILTQNSVKVPPSSMASSFFNR